METRQKTTENNEGNLLLIVSEESLILSWTQETASNQQGKTTKNEIRQRKLKKRGKGFSVPGCCTIVTTKMVESPSLESFFSLKICVFFMAGSSFSKVSITKVHLLAKVTVGSLLYF